ncbi:PWP2 small subunit processome component [Electrophorus electricus]|uniref:Small-subunit processome Utp12 domain-containing protein n=1 Tax=Electrophorus electricus TaxID=8005 RepID=A0A4W4GN96_ELEEL|nr:PWP2 small subunit processome component [Electrophorus electricus]
MKFAYKFSNLLGAVYRHGNLSFSKDGNSVISPVGNRISIFDLKNNKSETLPVSTNKNIACVGLSPDGNLAILVDEDGAAVLVSLITRAVLYHHHFHKPVGSIRFSPDGRKFVVTKENVALMYHAPGKIREFNTFALDKSYFGPYDETTCIDWTDDSKCFAVGSKDMTTWVFGAERWANLLYYSLGGHKDIIVGCFFEKDSLNLYTVSRDGTLCVWESDTELDGLRKGPKYSERKKMAEERKRRAEEEAGMEEEDKIVEIMEDDGEPRGEVVRGSADTPKEVEGIRNVRYKQKSKHFFNKEGDFNNLTAVAFHKRTHILVTGFASGAFYLHELPEFDLVHSLSISDQRISTIALNPTGDWIGFGCSGLGQLLVWEWQSESYVFKQQGHFNNMASLAYSPDGQYLATGGDDGKVKVWNCSSGLCFVTFKEHTSSITGVAFTSSGLVVLSASLDGTVRAFDLHRYRNFRTMTSPQPTQFSSLAVDLSGDLVCAGAQDSFEIFLWSMQTGRLLEVLSGHEGPVSCLCFSPVQSVLVSVSWDKTVRLWDMLDSWQTKEVLRLNSDGLAVAYRPDGQELAVATLDGEITFWSPQAATQTGSIVGRHDLQIGRKETEKITAKQSAKGKAFTCLCYSADGESMLAGGHSKFVCIYNIKEQILMKKFEISCNMSLDAMEEFLDRRKMTEFGSLALVDEGAGDGDGVELRLPGVRRGDMSSRHFKPEIRVTSLHFSPTGRSWAAASTEGLLVYSLDTSLVFDPYDLDMDVTPVSVRHQLKKKEWTSAIVLAFRLNETSLIREVLESVPYNQTELVSSSLPDVYVEKLLDFVASSLEKSRHLQFYLTWAQNLLTLHGQKLKSRSSAILTTIQQLLKSIQRHHDDLSKLCDWNIYTIRYTAALAKQRGMKRTATDCLVDEEVDEAEVMDSEDEEEDMSDPVIVES